VASLAALLDRIPAERVRDLLGGKRAFTVPEPARAFLLAAIAQRLSSPVLVVVAKGEEADHLARDIRAFLGPGGAEVFPGWEVLPGEPVSPSVETMGARLDVLHRLRLGGPFVVVATAQGVTQLVASGSRDSAPAEPEVIEPDSFDLTPEGTRAVLDRETLNKVASDSTAATVQDKIEAYEEELKQAPDYKTLYRYGNKLHYGYIDKRSKMFKIL
jgi:transcription-repair coupling factor (superfamily II helicase)